MSDRFDRPGYDMPRWDDEPDEFGSDTAAKETEPAPDSPELEESAPPDLDTSSENVLDTWSAPEADAAGDTPDDADAFPSSDLAGSVSGDAAPAVDAPADEPPAPLADHVSGTSEHAAGELTIPPGTSVLEGMPLGARRSVGIVVSRFNGDVTTRLLESALDELEVCGVPRESVTVMPVPGAFELPLAAMALAKTRRFACIVALGCVIRGDTPHFDYVSSEAASGLQLAAIETGVPVAFGVLTLDRADQAASRTGKGAEAVRTGLEMADVFANLRAAAAR